MFGQGTGPIAFSYTQCVGTETRLVDCINGTNRYCSHSYDVGVRCHTRTSE